jgi:hypothetical protein
MLGTIGDVHQTNVDRDYREVVINMPHEYKKSDCKFLIAAKKLPLQIVKIGGIDRLRNGTETHVITSWDTLYANISKIPDLNPAHKVAVEKIDPKGMTDEELAAFAKGES